VTGGECEDNTRPFQTEDKSTRHKTPLPFTQDIKERQESLSLFLFRVCSTRKCEDPKEMTADAPDQRKMTAKNQTELQIVALTKGTTKRSEERLRKTGESVISAIGLRKSGLFPFIKRDR